MTVLVPDSWHFVVTFPQLTLVLWMPLRAACVVVVRRGGVVDVAATLVVLWLFVMRRGNPDRFVNCGKSVLAFWEVQTIWNRRDEICNGALYFGTTYILERPIFVEISINYGKSRFYREMGIARRNHSIFKEMQIV